MQFRKREIATLFETRWGPYEPGYAESEAGLRRTMDEKSE